MDNLIYIWLINRLLVGLDSIIAAFFISFIFSFVALIIVTIGSICDDECRETFEKLKIPAKRWFICSTILLTVIGPLSAFRLSPTEFKTVAVYFIGKEIVQSDRGEKIISVIDTKLDEWIKKIEK